MNNKLRELQITQLEMLKLLDRICKENKLKYSLYAGTLLGAVRHGGFIPWDDDLDICMLRKDYERFIQIWNELSINGYILQNKENTPNFTQTFTKIRKDHTTFLQDSKEANKYHTGIFIDIFPIDRLPPSKIAKFFFKCNAVKYLLFTREHIPNNSGIIKKLLSRFVLFLCKNKEKARTKALEQIVKYNHNNEYNFIIVETFEALNITYPSTLCSSFTTIKFEDFDAMCFSDYTQALSLLYGDYMKLPPESERTWKHHPILLDFNKNYGE